MDSLFTFAKNNFDVITLLVAIVGVLVSIISFVYEVKKRKPNRKKQ